MKKTLSYLPAIFLAAFGLLTLFMSSSVIFDLFGIRAKQGNYVLFVVWTNLVCSLLYLPAAYGFIKGKKWTTTLLGFAVLLLVVAFLGLLYHISTGGIYETKTFWAMIFRTSITLIFMSIAYFTITKKLLK